MKQIIKLALSFAFFIFSKNVFCQFPEVGSFISNNDFGKFVGFWQYVNGIDTITIKLKRQMVQPPGKGGLEFVVGYHTYKKGNVVVENSMQYSTQAFNAELCTFIGLKLSGTGNSVLEVGVDDLAKSKKNKLELTISNNNTVLTANRIRFYGEKRQSGFTLPETFILNKLPPPPPTPPD